MAATGSTTETYRALASESRQALLDALVRRGEAMDAAQAGRAVRLHSNTARVHLERLVEAGLVVRVKEDRAKPGRPRVLYRAARPPRESGDASARGADYRELARLLAGQMSGDERVRARALEAGERWAASLDVRPAPRRALSPSEAVAAVVQVLGDLGFEPEPAVGEGSEPECLNLRRCPFEDVARENRAVVCAVHLGMLRATFDRLGANVSVGALRPFVADDPLLCVVDLAYARAARRRTTASKEGP